MIDVPTPPDIDWSSDKRDGIVCGDSQFVFLEAMAGQRSCVVTNGSTLFSGDAGGSESEIRKAVFDKVEKIIMLPSGMFANTGINTYIWVFGESSDIITLIDAHDTYTKMKRSVGDQRCYLADEDINRIVSLDVPHKVIDKEHFYYSKVWVTLDGTNKDTEIIPYSARDNDKAIRQFLEEYVRPYHAYKITKTIIGVEINFNKEFYVPEEIGTVEEIVGEIMRLEEEHDLDFLRDLL